MDYENPEISSLKEEIEKLNKVISVRNKDVELWMNDYYDSQDDLFEALAKLEELTKVSWRLIAEIQKIPSLGGLLRKSDLHDTYQLAAELENLVVEFKEEQQETCQGIIPNTFIACGEGGNYCQPSCQEQASINDKQLTENHFGGHVPIEITTGEFGADLYIHNAKECHGLHMHFPTRLAAREWLIDAWLRLDI